MHNDDAPKRIKRNCLGWTQAKYSQFRVIPLNSLGNFSHLLTQPSSPYPSLLRVFNLFHRITENLDNVELTVEKVSLYLSCHLYISKIPNVYQDRPDYVHGIGNRTTNPC
jgi:hypothetical protein